MKIYFAVSVIKPKIFEALIKTADNYLISYYYLRRNEKLVMKQLEKTNELKSEVERDF